MLSDEKIWTWLSTNDVSTGKSSTIFCVCRFWFIRVSIKTLAVLV